MQVKSIEGFQLSPQQKHLWLLQQGIYNLPFRSQCTILIEGNINKGVLKAALEKVVNRYDILRTNFHYLPGMKIPVQVISDQKLLSIHEHNLINLKPNEQKTKIDLLVDELKNLPFNFEQDIPLHLSLVALSSTKHILIFSLPSIYGDTATLNNLLREIILCYIGCLDGQDISSESLQYADISEWQNELLESEDEQTGKLFWQKINRANIPAFSLPFECKFGKAQEFTPKNFSLEIEPNIVKKIEEITQKYETSVSSFFLTCWQILLFRLSGQADIIVGTSYDCRKYEELVDAIGLLEKYLPIHSHIEKNIPFHKLLCLVDESTREAYKWQYFFDCKEVEISKKATDLYYHFQFNFREYNHEDLLKFNLEQISFSHLDFYSCIDKFKVQLSLSHTNESLKAKLFYDKTFFSTQEIQILASQFYNLVKYVIENSTSEIGELEILSDIERQLLFEVNDTKTDYPKHLCIHELFESQVEQTPDAIAVVFEEQQITYRELNCRANQLAHHLQQLGVKPGVLVAVYLERSLQMIAAVLGILKAGGAYVPLEPSFPKVRVQLLLCDLKINYLVTQTSLLPPINELQQQLPALKHLICLDKYQKPDLIDHSFEHQQVWMSSYLEQLPIENLPDIVSSDNVAYVIFTSGSTGTPKGVFVRHQPVINLINWVNSRFNINSSDRVLFITSLCFDLSVYDIFGLLAAGGSIQLVSSHDLRDPEKLLHLLCNEPITLWDSAPAALQQLLPFFPVIKSINQNSQLRLAFLSGDWIPVTLPDLVRTAFPGVEIISLGGATEATIWSNYYPIGQVEPHWISIPYGKPIQNAQYYILDSYLNPCPIGVPGELYIGGECLACGYFHEPILTAQKFIPNPLSDVPEARLYKTGDLARYLLDGNIEFLGRIDNQVKIRGFRIELGEIDTALRKHPEVRETVVIAVDDGLSTKRLVAYIVPQRSLSLTISELRSFLQKQLPDYMVPSAFVMLDALPLSISGKLDRRALPAPDWTRPELEVSFIAPRTPEEQLLANIWAQVLGVERVGVQDNFFELGGDSILSIQIVARAKEAGLCLTPMQLFQHQTIAQLIAVATKTPELQTDQGLVTGEVPLTAIQQWFFEQNLPEPHHWNVSIVLETPSNVNPNWLEQVIQHLNKHHDALRLCFEQGGGGLRQIHSNADVVPFSRIDLSALPQLEQISAMEAEVAQMQVKLNLSTAPMMRVALFDLGTHQSGRLAIVMHHLIMDGISWRIWLEDFHKAYQQLSQGAAIQLPAKTTSFKHWSEHLSIYAQSTALEPESDYWLRNCLDQVPPLPRDDFEQPNTVASARTVCVSLSREDTQALLQEVPAAYQSKINDLLLTALALAFRQWTGENTLLVDLEGHGREALFNDVDVSRTIGWFTTRFPILLDLGSTQASDEVSSTTDLALKSVKEQLRQIPNRGIGYGLLRYLSGNPEITKKLQVIPQPEVNFNYLGQFDRVLSESTLFRLAKESTGAERSLQGTRTHLIAIDAIALEGKLQLNWTYSENVHRRSTIENLAENFIVALEGIIRHCLFSGGGYTPSDFPLAKLNQQQIDRLSAKFAIEDIYCLSHLQQGLLFHSLYTPESKLYFQQKIFTLQGNLNVSAFKQAWQKVFNRYPSLRSAFIWKDLDEPLQLVLKNLEVPWEQQDWCHLSTSEQEEQLQAYLQADLHQGFSLSDTPPIRLALIQTAKNIHQLLWSHHHLILDGWCNSIILKEVFNFYEALCNGQDLYLEDSPPYRNYIAWLQQQDWSGAEIFWRQMLMGLRAPTQIKVSVSGSLLNLEQQHAQERIQLSADVTSALQSFARQHHLTLNTLIQGVWALLLSRYSGEEDVVFGATVSGRPPELPGVESMVGLLINTLPVRVQVSPHVSLLCWLKQLQQQQAELLEYQYSPLLQVQAWSEVPKEMPLFESLVTFENYPVDASLLEGNDKLKILDVRSFSRTNFPLSVTVEMGATLLLQITYAPDQFDAPTIRQMLKQIQVLLENIPLNCAHLLSQISLTDAAETQQLINSFNVDLESC
jgi:amino acid adenylation domain-containing protein/non-ribosomal peptide synthase protein (TIGR01720 family)